MLNPFKLQKSYGAFLQSRITKHRIIASHPRIQLRHNETSTENPEPEPETPKPKKTDLPLLSSCIGIDFGHTNSLVGINEPTELRIIENPEGFRVTPTMVGYTEDKQVLVGVAAKRQAAGNPLHTFYDLRNLMGAPFDEKFKESFAVVEHEKMLYLKGREGVVLPPVEVTGVMLNYMKEIAEGYLGGRVAQAVVSVPHSYTPGQRDLLKSAGRNIGLKVRALIEDPVAVATSYGFADESHNGKKLLIFDMGGKALDISIVQVESGVPVVKKTFHEWEFGGEKFDRLITEFLAKDFEKVNKLDLLKDRFATARLMEQAERVKVELTNSLTTEVNLPYIAMLPEKGPLHINMHMSRAKFENIASSLLNKIIPAIDACLASGEITKEAVDAVLLSGGMTRMPKIQEIIESHLGKAVTKITAPEEAVVMGAAILGSKLPPETEFETRVGDSATAKRDRYTRIFVEPKPEDDNKNLTEAQIKEILIPLAEEKGFLMRYTPEKPEKWDDEKMGEYPEVEKSVEEEVWAAKPKYQNRKFFLENFYKAGPNTRERGGERLGLFDKLPVQVSISGETGQHLVVFDTSTPLPASKTLCLCTVADNQRELFLNVHEKEDNKNYSKLGVFRFGGITPAKQGKSEVNVTFDVDSDGVLTVTARENKLFARNVTKRGFYLAQEISRPLAEKEMYKRLQGRIDYILDFFSALRYSPEKLVAEAELREVQKCKEFRDLFIGFTSWRNSIAEQRLQNKTRII